MASLRRFIFCRLSAAAASNWAMAARRAWARGEFSGDLPAASVFPGGHAQSTASRACLSEAFASPAIILKSAGKGWMDAKSRLPAL
jgi:hypothetical protein